VESDGVTASRGSSWRSFFALTERHVQQDIAVRIRQHDSGARSLVCEYSCFCPYPAIHIAPWNFHEQEVRQLEAWLGGASFELSATKTGGRHGAVRRFLLNLPLRILYRAYRIFSWFRYRVLRRLTPAGLLVFIAVVVAGTTGVDTETTVAYQAFAPLLLLLLFAAACSWTFRLRFSAVRRLPRFGTVGQPFSYDVVLENPGRKPESDLLLLENLEDPRLSFPEWRAVQLADGRRMRSFRIGRRKRSFKVALVKNATVPPLRPAQPVEVCLELTPLRRGVIRFAGVTLARPDPFGLFRAFCKKPLPQSLLVLPRRYPLPPVALPGTMRYQEGGVALAANVGQSDEFVSLRDYRRGDPLRHIHWRSWAKAGKPIVKEFEDEFFVRHALVLDTFIDDPRSEAFEEAVSVAASFACTIQIQESLLDLLFVGKQAYCFTAGRGLAHADQMLEILASVQPCGDQEFHALEHLVLDRMAALSGCICVLLAWDRERRDFVEKLRALGLPLLVLVITEPGLHRPLDPGPMHDRPEWFHVFEAGRVEEGLRRLTL
jgi:uncharacterized protein (DUF58 family)